MDDILCYIFSFLYETDLLNCILVCKRWLTIFDKIYEYEKTKYKGKNINHILKNITYKNKIITLKRFLEENKHNHLLNFNYILYGACKGNHKELVELIIKKRIRGSITIDFNFGLEGACKEGHKEMVEYMILHGANDFYYGLEGACKGGNKELVLLMIKRS